MSSHASALALLTCAGFLAGCGDPDIAADVGDATALPYADGSPEGVAILAVANNRALDVAAYDEVVGLSAKAAANLIAHRDGASTDSGDDDPFDKLAELWAVSYCKRSCFDALLGYAKDTGVYGASDRVAVIFSPQPSESSHLVAVAERIDAATETIDIAMYSYSHQDPVRGALSRARERGVTIRMVADADLANDAGKCAGLEQLGIDVRTVTKIMHHKFAVIDGPRDASRYDKAGTATVITGSGNWSGSAATKYDENTLFLHGAPELALRLQRDFDKIWGGSKDVAYAPLTWDRTSADISDALVAENDSPDMHALFTSFNFEPSGTGGWSYQGTTVVTDGLVQAILGADESLRIASGHFVSTPVAEAVLALLEQKPGVRVELALDCQEATQSGAIIGLKKAIEERGGSIFYKCNSYRWHYTTQAQLHHKYLVIDEDELWTGSLNLSENAETNTFENMLWFGGSEHHTLVQQYLANFEVLRAYGRANDMAALTELRAEIETGDSVPLVWNTPIMMELSTFSSLKALIRQECPATNSATGSPESKTYNQWFNTQPQWFKRCEKSGYPWPLVPEDKRL